MQIFNLWLAQVIIISGIPLEEELFLVKMMLKFNFQVLGIFLRLCDI